MAKISSIKGPLKITDDWYVSTKNQEEGENDLMDVAREFDIEGFWTYSPKKGLWIHNPCERFKIHDQTGKRIGQGIKVSRRPSKEAIGEFATEYHTHPGIEAYRFFLSYLKADNELMNSIKNPNTPAGKRFIKGIKAKCAFPSTDDIDSMKIDPYGNVQGIATPHSINLMSGENLESFNKSDYLSDLTQLTLVRAIKTDEPLDTLVHNTAEQLSEKYQNHILFDVRTRPEE